MKKLSVHYRSCVAMLLLTVLPILSFASDCPTDAGSITGEASICPGVPTAYMATVSDGVWSSSNTSIATVNAAGVVTGVAGGTATISYSITNDCGTVAATATVTVNTVPAGPITGTSYTCSGATVTFNDVNTGGTWTSSNTARATVDAMGTITGVSSGTAVITHTVSGDCGTAFATRIVTVNPTLPTIGGASSVCLDASVVLTNSIAGGEWSSSNTSVATIDASGRVTGEAAGSVIITYAACSNIKTKTISVNPLPSVPEISAGTGMVCSGATLALSESTVGGTRFWSSSNTAIATINSSTGLVTGVAGGTATISYRYTLGCTNYAMTTVTVNAPTAATISGTAIVCASGSTTLSTTMLTAEPEGGTWSGSAPTKATIDASSGLVTGVASGTAPMTYTYVNENGCTSRTIKIVTVNVLPTIATPGGASSVCFGATATLTESTTGGTWSSANTEIATIGSSTGIATGVYTGTVVMSYTFTGLNGCTSFKTKTVTVNALPSVPEISAGTGMTCAGTTLALSESTTGGTYLWSSDNTAVATVNSTTGVVTGVSGGTATVSYRYTLGCINYATTVVTVNTATSATIMGMATICAGGSTTLTAEPTEGTWSSSAPTKATVNASTGVVTGVAAGTSLITYTYVNSNGCISRTYGTVTVNALPTVAAMSGATSVCLGATATVTNTTTGGAWSSSNTEIATIGSTGIVTGIDPGTTVISYSVTGSNGCSTIKTKTLTVNPLPVVPEISAGSGIVCIGSTLALSESTTGGSYSWISNNTTKATVSATTGVVTGVATGTVIISYKYTLGCINYAMTTVTVNPAMAMIVTGTAAVCGGGNATTFTGTPAGGSWSSSAPAIATVNASGLVTGLDAGTALISYTSASGCYKTRAITVHPQPAAIVGPDNICAGTTATYSSPAAGDRTWTSSNTSVAVIGSSSGVVSAMSAGTANVTLTVAMPGGCSTSKLINVNPMPAPISGVSSLCAGSTTTVMSGGVSGTWSSTVAGVATVGSTGIVTGISAGVTNILYTTAAGCAQELALTINPRPEVITGITTVCTGSVSQLGNATTGATWSSSTPSAATITAGGLVSGVSAGTTVVSYTLATGCTRTTTITVVTSLPALTGTPVTCVGLTTTLSSSAAGGTWNTGNGVIATVSSGVVSGVTTGTTNITYTLMAGCAVAANVTVNSMVPVITGTPAVCVNSTTSLGNSLPGGTWSSSNPAFGTISASGMVTGISEGVTTISYNTGSGCYRALNVVVKGLPGAIAGDMGVCIGGTSVATDGTGTSWASSNTSVATIGVLSGVITGVSAGTSMITFNATNGCIATRMVTVDAATSVAAITGPSGVLVGGTITLNNATPGGTWSSNSDIRATVSAAGVVTGISAPAVIISYTVTSGVCKVSATKLITVTTHRHALPGTQEEAQPVAGVSLYPNPTSGAFTVQSPVAGTFTVYTLEGRAVQSANMTAGANKLTLSREFAAGIYICRFMGEDGSNTMVRLVYE